MGTITAVLNILGLAESALPVLERIFGGLMTYAATIAKQIWGDHAAQKLDDMKVSAAGHVQTFEDDAAGAVDLIKGLAPDLDALFAMFAGLPKQLAAEYNLMQGHGVPRSLATTVVKAAHSDMKVGTA